MLVGLRVGVHPRHVARAARQHGGAVALAAGHVHHVAARAARRDPLVHGQVAPEPVVLLGHVRQRALAGQGERRHARRADPAARTAATSAKAARSIVLRRPRLPPMAAAHATRSTTPTSATTTSRPRTTTPSGASTTASAGQAQVTGKLRKALGEERPARFARGARDRRRHRLLRAQPDAGRRGRRAVGHRHLAGDARRRSRARAERLGRRRRSTARCEADALPFDDDSFDLVFGHAVLHHLPDLEGSFREFLRVLRPGRHDRLLRRAVALRRPDRRRCPSARPYALAPAWRRADRRCRGASTTAITTAPRRTTSSRSWTCTRSRRARSADAARARGLRGRPRARRGARRQPVRLDQPRARGDRRARGGAVAAGASTPTAATSRCRRSTARCSSRACRRRSSTTCSSPRARRRAERSATGEFEAVGGRPLDRKQRRESPQRDDHQRRISRAQPQREPVWTRRPRSSTPRLRPSPARRRSAGPGWCGHPRACRQANARPPRCALPSRSRRGPVRPRARPGAA